MYDEMTERYATWPANHQTESTYSIETYTHCNTDDITLKKAPLEPFTVRKYPYNKIHTTGT